MSDLMMNAYLYAAPGVHERLALSGTKSLVKRENEMAVRIRELAEVIDGNKDVREEVGESGDGAHGKKDDIRPVEGEKEGGN
jgi:hypothetical protein